MPRAVVVTKLDHARADYDGVLAQARGGVRRQGAAGLPAATGDAARRAASTGDRTTRRRTTSSAAALIEGVIEESEDETLMDRYLGGEEIDADAARRGPRAGGRPRRASTRSYPSCSTTGVGAARAARPGRGRLPVAARAPAARGVHAGRPAAGRRSRCDPDGPLVAEVVKTTSDPYVGRVSLVRVFSGTLRPDATVHVSGHCTSFVGRRRRATRTTTRTSGSARCRCPLGEDAAAGRPGGRRRHLRDRPAQPGRDRRHAVRPRTPRWCCGRGRCPSRCCRSRSRRGPRPTRTSSARALARLARRGPDAARRAQRRDPPARALDMGEAHADVLLDRLANRYGVARRPGRAAGAAAGDVRRPGRGHGRHVKQSGGHGQYAVCDIEVEPLPEGAGFEFVDKVVGGAVPRQFIPSVEKGVRAQMERGVRAGYPVVDVRVTLLDGKAHSVDSSDMAFQTAGGAGPAGGRRGDPDRLLEPVDEVVVLVPDELVGARDERPVRRGAAGCSAASPAGDDRTVVRAEVPAASRSAATRWTCARSRTAPRRSPAPSPATSRCPTTGGRTGAGDREEVTGAGQRAGRRGAARAWSGRPGAARSGRPARRTPRAPISSVSSGALVT